jgi:O-antigen/teichoic acid export membrane protein
MLSGQIIGKAGLFVSLMIYSRILGDDPFGELLFAVSIGLIVIFLNDMGVTMLVTRRIAAGSDVNSTLSAAVVLRSVLSIVTVLAVMAVGRIVGYSSRQLVLILLVSSGFVLDGFLETSFAVFRAKEVMINEGAARLLLGLLVVSLAVYARYTGRGVYFAGAMYVVRQIPAVVFAYYMLHRMGFRLDVSHQVIKSVIPLFKAAVPLGIVGLLIVASQRLDSSFVKSFLSDSAVAAWQQCYRMLEPMVLLVAPTLLPGALFADLCKAEKMGWLHVKSRIKWMTELFTMIAFTLIIPLYFTGMRVLNTVWGDSFLRDRSYGDVQLTLRILLISLPVTYIFHIYLALLLAQRRQRTVVPAALFAIFIQFAGLATLLSGRGIYIVAIMQLAFITIITLYLGISVWRKFGETGFAKGIKRPVTALLFAVPVLAFQPLSSVNNAVFSVAALLVVWFIIGGGRIISRPSINEKTENQ